MKHQIDAVVGATRKRVLIEAKDYDKRVGLPVVRNFWAVVEDLKPDESFVVTTDGFTRPAREYAAAKGVKLALLRPPREDDWGNLVRHLDFEVKFSAPGTPNVEWFIDQAEAHRFAEGRNPIGHRAVDEIQVMDEAGQTVAFGPILQAAIDAQYGTIPPGQVGELGGEETHESPTWLVIEGEDPLQVTGWAWKVSVASGTHGFSVGDGVGGLAAELVLRTVDGSIHRMFTNKQIASWTFDGKTVVLRA